MSVTTSRAELAEALALVQTATDRKSSIPALACVQLSFAPGGLRLGTTDTTAACVRVVPASGTIDPVAVDCATLAQIAKALPGDSVTLAPAGSRLVVQGGSSQFKLPTMTEFPPLPEFAATSSATIAAPDLLRLTEQCGFAVADDDVRYGLNGAHIEVDGEALAMVSTDGHRLSRASTTFVGAIAPPERSLIPRKAIAAIRHIVGRAGDVTLEYGEGGWIRIGGSFWFRLIDGEFPDYRSIIPTETKHKIRVDRDGLAAAAGRAALVARHGQSVRFAFADELTISARSAETGEASEVVPCETANPIELGLNIRYLSEILAVIPSASVSLECAHALAPVVVRGDGDESAMFLIMPMRLD